MVTKKSIAFERYYRQIRCLFPLLPVDFVCDMAAGLAESEVLNAG